MPLYVDIHEPEDIIQMFKKKNLAIEVKRLESGDYVFGEVALERKTVSDLINSVTGKNRHLWRQLDTLKRTYQQPILLIEGYIDTDDKYLMGIITTVLLFWKYQIIHTLNKRETVSWIEKLFVKYGVGKTNRIPPVAKIKAVTPKEVKLAMLQQIPYVGPKTANKILESIPYIFNNPQLPKIEAVLKQMKGLNRESVNVITKIFNGEC